jgi:hypothetical protein
MRLRLAAALAAVFAMLAFTPARADLLIQIDKATQQMTVSADGELLYTWPVSTGRDGYDTPNGAFNPLWMDRDHHSEEWDDAPMPYSIFFTKQGHAIHGTYEVRHLGQPVSHGCVRLSVKNASILWDLVKQHKRANTMVVLTGETPGSSGLTVARVQRDGADIADAPPPRQPRASHYYYGPPRVFFGGERTYFPLPRRYLGGFPFGW